ncbi:Ribonuclease P/MRP protein subunit POP5 [Vanrija pseudolonga]|uniref:Ribonuclease P/MRP protein subunit POP5 n=1 Tax=Vanrija pseudolonga TaxID=143232 RepID=A0AAF1BNV8_9TREE|nr:Ribonuclease P/MRP protein subunit POP5 [Vanrija pseudolonga]
MVRFKYRNLLVEFLDPGAVAPFPPAPPTLDLDEEDAMNGDIAADGDGGAPDDPEDELLPTPAVPFVLPLPEAAAKPLLGDDASSAIFRAIKGSVQAVFGDEGWGRVASSLRVIYSSPYTTLTIVRVARPHYRLLWSAITMLTAVGSTPVLPRVVAVSGTVKKLQSVAITHHRRVVAAAVAALLAQGEKGQGERERLQTKWDHERQAIARLED